MNSIRSIGRNLEVPTKEKDDEDAEYEMIWDAEGSAHPVAKVGLGSATRYVCKYYLMTSVSYFVSSSYPRMTASHTIFKCCAAFVVLIKALKTELTVLTVRVMPQPDILQRKSLCRSQKHLCPWM